MTFHLEIITPDKVVFSDAVDEVVVPTTNGQIGILANHVSLVAKLAHGELIVKKGNSEHYLAVEGGFVDVSQNNATILADYAIRSEEIEVEKTQAAMKRAKDLMERKVSEEDFAQAQSELRRSLLELKVVERRRHRSRVPIVS